MGTLKMRNVKYLKILLFIYEFSKIIKAFGIKSYSLDDLINMLHDFVEIFNDTIHLEHAKNKLKILLTTKEQIKEREKQPITYNNINDEKYIEELIFQ